MSTTNTPRLTLASFSPASNASFNLSALTGGVRKSDGILGYSGADYFMGINDGYIHKTMGGNQAVFSDFADSGSVSRGTPYASNITQTVFAAATDWSGPNGENADTGAQFNKSNWMALRMNGANQGRRWDLIATREVKQMLVALELDAGSYQINATISDGSLPPAQLVYSGSAGQRWFTLEWKAAMLDGIDKHVNLEVRKTNAGAGNLWTGFAYIGVPITENLPGRGLKNALAQTGFYGGSNL